MTAVIAVRVYAKDYIFSRQPISVNVTLSEKTDTNRFDNRDLQRTYPKLILLWIGERHRDREDLGTSRQVRAPSTSLPCDRKVTGPSCHRSLDRVLGPGILTFSY